ncbi:hypothetical protein DB88DRAFT_480030 [Papiliotrema laurentii]|uniref:Peptidase A1 domain-containing protein n=1 Tax=Papiliotrema laurentii TaxID=5418 RepID=A0AAD9FXE4_PAPLA|nr:hypothetical protein DB88DRAFT_480030 [Papiliotrema laurentii]
MFSIPCTTNAKVSLKFGSATFPIDTRDFLFQPLNNDLKGDCISAITAETVSDAETWLLGDNFLKKVYMSTNSQTLTVTLSARTDVPASSSVGRTDPAAVASLFPGSPSSLTSGGHTEQQALANDTASRDRLGGEQLANGSGRAGSLDLWLQLQKVLQLVLGIYEVAQSRL